VKRLHLFEFGELEWFPSLLRDMETDLLRFYGSRFNPYGPAVPRLKQVLAQLGCTNLVDLCSGGGGPVVQIHDRLLSAEKYPVSVTLTDKFPNVTAFRQAVWASNGRITGMETPVDATDVPEHLQGFRTLFASFHHFEPERAARILEDAVRKREGIGVFEFTARSPVMCLAMLLSPLFAWLATPFLRPFSWRRLLWTYLVPLVPLMVLWDGMVSNLRTYSPTELRELVGRFGSSGYSWETARLWSWGGYRITYLIGYPVDS